MVSLDMEKNEAGSVYFFFGFVLGSVTFGKDLFRVNPIGHPEIFSCIDLSNLILEPDSFLCVQVLIFTCLFAEPKR